ncbi:extracellular solute-binding protein [Candidatus Peregrinibacteria bacterium]|nr:MAG: extracellular solute-binding protein [Candidatus Peregrinibacteria bacterium]
MSGILFSFGLLLLTGTGLSPSPYSEVASALVFEKRVADSTVFARNIEEHVPALEQWTKNIFSVSPEESLTDPTKLIQSIPEKLSVWTYGISPDSFRWAYESLQKRFPSAEVDIRFITNENDYLLLLSSSFRQGLSPDIFLVSSVWRSEYESLFADAPEIFFSPEECFETFLSSSCSAFEKEGKMKGVPLFVDAPFLIVNRTLLSDDRVAVSGKPEASWQGFLSNRKNFEKYSKNNKNSFVSIPLQENSSLFSLLFFSLLAQAESTGEKMTDSTLEIFQLLDLLTTTEGGGKHANTDAQEQFLNGESAILIGTNETLQHILQKRDVAKNPKIEKKDILTLPLPQLDQKNPIIAGETRALVVSKRSAYQREAWALALFLAFRENQTIVLRQDNFFSARNDLFSENKMKSLLSGIQNLPNNILDLAFRKQLLENGMRFFSGEISAEEASSTALSSFLQNP